MESGEKDGLREVRERSDREGDDSTARSLPESGGKVVIELTVDSSGSTRDGKENRKERQS